MIHYGIQYSKILEIQAQEIAAAKCELDDAEREAREISRKNIEAGNLVSNLRLELEKKEKIFLEIIKSDIVTEVEKYKTDHGSYPI